jgi:diguanylate cyclase (GGDEF)-like protein
MGDMEDDDPECTAVASRAELNAAIAAAAKGKKKQRPWIVIVTGSAGAGKMVRLDGELVIGRVATAGFRIDEDGVSRQHAKLVIAPEGTVQIIDLDSRNGTFVNGDRVTRCDLRDGDKIQIGNTTILKFSYQDAMDEELQKNLYESATQDGLTKLANKKSFTEVLAREVSFAERHGRPLALSMFDVDHFKKVNDTFGHPAGDHVLRTLAQIVLSKVRAEDIVARVGGEEFAILLRDSATDAAVHCAERVRAAVQAASIVFDGKRIPITISIGVGTLAPGQHLTPAQLVALADQRLYQAKQTGRNKVVAA